MKKVISILFIAMAVATTYGMTLRVNNAVGNGAPYTTAADAIAAASDGDVIILEASAESYGDFTVNKKVTIQGEGYWRDVNGITQEGATDTEVNKITVEADGAKISSLKATDIILNASNIIVTRCNTMAIALGKHWKYADTPISNCIIHQNFIKNGVMADRHSLYSENLQITNNIIHSATPRSTYIKNSIISRNTFSKNFLAWAYIYNCIFENNVGGDMSDDNNQQDDNTYTGNIKGNFSDSDFDNDKAVKEAGQRLGYTEAGAFSGEDPYVLSGVAPGPRVIDLTVPESVEQGEDLRVTVKIGSSK